MTFGREFTRAVEQKQIAQQDAERARFIVEKAEQERQANVIRAEGEADSADIISKAVAKAGDGLIQIRRIEASKDIAQTLAANPNVTYLPGGGEGEGWQREGHFAVTGVEDVMEPLSLRLQKDLYSYDSPLLLNLSYCRGGPLHSDWQKCGCQFSTFTAACSAVMSTLSYLVIFTADIPRCTKICYRLLISFRATPPHVESCHKSGHICSIQRVILLAGGDNSTPCPSLLASINPPFLPRICRSSSVQKHISELPFCMQHASTA